MIARRSAQSVRRTLSSPFDITPTLSGDSRGLGVLALIVAFVLVDQIRSGRNLFRIDIIAAYLPWYTYMGERLRVGDIPGWLPFTFGGNPFLGDPQSGWSYLPAMLIFTFWGSVTGFKIFIAFHVILAAFSTYALARVLRVGPAGAVVAGGTYAFGGLLERTRCCTIHAEVAVWLPLAFIGVELALRAKRPSRAFAWLALTGFCFSQMVAGWSGKGAYYGMLAIAAFSIYRVLVYPRIGGRRRAGRRIVVLLAIGAVVGGVGLGLAAYGLLPRFAAIAETHLSDGYEDATRVWSPLELVDRVVSNDDRLGRWYAGASLMLVALIAPFVVRRGTTVRFWYAYGGMLLLSVIASLWIWWPAYALLPRFEELHRHLPDQALTVFYIAPALLAGMVVDAFWRSGAPLSRGLAAAVVALIVVLTGLQYVYSERIDWRPGVVAMAGVGVALVVGSVRPSWHRWVAVAIGIVVLLDPTIGGAIMRLPGNDTDADQARVVANYTQSTPAIQFLQERAASEPPFRFFGYDPALMRLNGMEYRSYIIQGVFAPEPPALLVNNRAVLFGLEDVQGYNPVQSKGYVELMEVANGASQSYHFANVLPRGWDSGLFDLLNVRYIVVPRDVPAGRPDLLHLSLRYPTVYADDDVRIVRNDNALPRAWLAHTVEQIEPARILPLLDERRGDPRSIVYWPTGEAAPPVDPGAATAGESVEITHREPDRLELQVVANGDGIVVLSEQYAPGWRATLDGEAVPIHDVDVVLRGVSTPAGTHTLVLTFTPPRLRLGMAVTAMTMFGAVAAFAALSYWEQPNRRRRFSVRRSGRDAGAGTREAIEDRRADSRGPRRSGEIGRSPNDRGRAVRSPSGRMVQRLAKRWSALD